MVAQHLSGHGIRDDGSVSSSVAMMCVAFVGNRLSGIDIV